MNAPNLLSDSEQLWLFGLIGVMVGCILWAGRSRDPRAWIQPPMVMVVILLLYAVAGPLYFLDNGLWFDRGANLRSGLGMAWAGACVALLAFLAGYGGLRQRLKPPLLNPIFQLRQADLLGKRLNIIAVTVYSLVAGSRLIAYLNPFGVAPGTSSSRGFDLGAFEGYALLSINLMIPGCLLLAAAASKRKRFSLELALWLLTACAVYTSIGFRWRIAMLLGSMAILWFIQKANFGRLLMIIGGGFSLLFFSGLMAVTREYHKGLDLSRLDGLGLWDILMASLGETKIFLTSGVLMEMTPRYIPFVGFQPIINTLLFPFPKSLFQAKDSASYLFDSTAIVYGSDVHNAGSAILNFAEYFLMAGWPTLVLGAGLLGWIYRRLWLWFRPRVTEPLAQVAYVANVGFMVMVVSRGYLPQVVMLWCFTCAPLFLLYRHNLRREMRAYRAFQPRKTDHLLPPHLRQLRL